MDDNVFDLNSPRAESVAREIQGRRQRRLRYAAWAVLVAVFVGIAAAPTLFTSLLDALNH